MRLAAISVLLAVAVAGLLALARSGGEGDPPAPSASTPEARTRSAPATPESVEARPGDPSAPAAETRDRPSARAASGTPPPVSLEWVGPIGSDLLAGRWADLEEGRASLTDAGPGAALDLLAAAGSVERPLDALVLALLVEDFLDSQARDALVAAEVERRLAALLRAAYDADGLEGLRPLALRVLGHLPGPETEDFLLSRLDAGTSPEIEALLVDSLGRAGSTRAAGVLAHRFERAREVDSKRRSLLALSRIRDRTLDRELADLVLRSFADLVDAAAASPPDPESEEWFYLTLALVDGTSPAETIARRILAGDVSAAAKGAALAYLDRAGRPEDAPPLTLVADEIADRDLARRTRELAERLLARGR